MINFWIRLVFGLFVVSASAQNTITGMISGNGEPLSFANVYLKGTSFGTTANEKGHYTLTNIPNGNYTLVASFIGFEAEEKKMKVEGTNQKADFNLSESYGLDEVVITGTLKPVSRLESPVPVEIYSPAFFNKNPTANIFEALQNVNGVRPQLNCNVCNTGDIHINGLEGPYTLVLLDGMPIVSGLSTVYGLSGIPNSLIEQIEIVKGPASSLYGSEAVGGLINIITKLPEHSPKLSWDAFVSGWGETNIDLGFKAQIGSNTTLLLGANYFNYSNPIDENGDNFTDLTLQDRISIFQKWNFQRNQKRLFSLAARFFYEDRWGGEMQWNRSFRGGDEWYGESIYTLRYELIGAYQLPMKEKVTMQFSYSFHDQNSVYGIVPFLAEQKIGFVQGLWDKSFLKHEFLLGAAARYNFYNDNTTATITADEVTIPSLFVQDEWSISQKENLLMGVRYDYDPRHGSIFTPRMAYLYKSNQDAIFRINAGTGFRVVNLFTEEHAALTGAREVIISETLNPEKSYNLNLNYLKKFYSANRMIFTLDTSIWYTHFTNAISPDYDKNPNQIIYENLDGYATSKGVSVNLDAFLANGVKAIIGFTYQDVSQREDGITSKQILTEEFSGTWALSYKLFKANLLLDYTGNLYGPMRLPILGPLDPRKEYAPVWSVQNIQLTFDGWNGFEIYGGIKNLLNWTPNRGNPFIIARANDPFDENVLFDNQGNVVPTANNPYALTFDPSYVYAPNQGRRLFFGIRFQLQ